MIILTLILLLLQFAPAYHDYVLYSDGSQEVPTKYRVRTFVPTGQEMETLRKHKQMFGAGKLDEANASTLSSPNTRNQASVTREGDVMQNPLLFDPHTPFSTVYDMSPMDGTSPETQPRSQGRVNDFDQRRSTLGEAESRRISIGTEALETTQLAPGRRRSSQGALVNETEQDQYFEGYVQR